jgi:hypothetical protein
VGRLPACTFNHVKRDANMAAHELAKRAMHNHERVVQRHETPDEVHSVVMTETAAGEEHDPLIVILKYFVN